MDKIDWGWVETRPAFRVVGNKVFPFLKLPGELRNRVYEVMYLDDNVFYGWLDSNISRNDRNLLETCRQIYQEGASVLYGTGNRFDLDSYYLELCAPKIKQGSIKLELKENRLIIPTERVISGFKTFTSLEKLLLSVECSHEPCFENPDEYLVRLRGPLLAIMEIISPSVEIYLELHGGTQCVQTKVKALAQRLKPLQGSALNEPVPTIVQPHSVHIL